MMEIGPKIDLYNLTPKTSETTTVVNNIFHLSGPGSNVVQGDDHSTNTITVNEKELFESLASAITSAVADTAERTEILARLDELKAQKTKTDYLAMIPKFITAATSIGHIIAPYLPALMEKAEQLARG
jgi:glutamine synthetase adenylyltransferase